MSRTYITVESELSRIKPVSRLQTGVKVPSSCLSLDSGTGPGSLFNTESEKGIHGVLKPCFRTSTSEEIGIQQTGHCLHPSSALPAQIPRSFGLLDWLSLPGTPGFSGARQLAIHHSYLLALAASGPWPGWAQGARRGSRAEGIDNKKAAVPWGNFKVPGAEIYVLKRLSPGPEGCSPYRDISRTYRVPGAVLGGLGDLLSSWLLVAEFSLGEA